MIDSQSRAARWAAAGLALAAGTYAVLVAYGWCRYGRNARSGHDERDDLLDVFMPDFDVAGRHHVRVAAPAGVVLDAAATTDLQRSPIVRSIFRAREVVLRAAPDTRSLPRGLLAQVTSLGWRVLAEVPGRELVVGAVTQPWQSDVEFRGLSPEEFRRFRQPGYVKIAWTLRADPVTPTESIFRTETRAVATDPAARARFRWYWARFSPGIDLIRRVMLRVLKADAERLVRLPSTRLRPGQPDTAYPEPGGARGHRYT